MYFLDTNIIIDILDGKTAVRDRFYKVAAFHEIRIPDIVFYEVMRGFKYRDSENKRKQFEFFCTVFGIEYLTQKSLETAAEIYAQLKHEGQIIEDDDIFIASLARACNATLVTNNARHFKRVAGLVLEEWV